VIRYQSYFSTTSGSDCAQLHANGITAATKVCVKHGTHTRPELRVGVCGVPCGIDLMSRYRLRDCVTVCGVRVSEWWLSAWGVNPTMMSVRRGYMTG